MRDWESLQNLTPWLRSASLESMILVMDALASELDRRDWPGRLPLRVALTELLDLRDRMRAVVPPLRAVPDDARRAAAEQQPPLDYSADG